MSVLYENYIINDDSKINVYGLTWRAQSFTPSISHDIGRVRIKWHRTGSPGNVTISIKATDGNGHPTGADLCSGTINGNTISASFPTWSTLDFTSSYALTSGVKYAIVVRAPTGDNFNHMNWRYDSAAATYTGGNYEYSTNGGATWSSSSDADMMFEEWSPIQIELTGRLEGFLSPASPSLYTNRYLDGTVRLGAELSGQISVPGRIDLSGSIIAGLNLSNTSFLVNKYLLGSISERLSLSGVLKLQTLLTDRYAHKQLFLISNNRVYYENDQIPTQMDELTAAANDIDALIQLTAAGGYGKVFIANNSSLKVADFINTKFQTTDIGSYYPDKMNILTGATSSAQMAVDYITSLVSASVVYGMPLSTVAFENGETVSGVNDNANAVSFVLSAAQITAPHWFDWKRYGNDGIYGILPSYASLVCLYRGRVVLSGDSQYPHQWYMSRQGDPWDWNYIANDAQSPVAGHNADVGEIGDIITALIPRKDDYLIFGCSSSIWILRGDPCTGGSLDEVSLTTGIFGANSWCWDDTDTLYFWGSNGIYRLSAQTGQIKNLSMNRIPDIVKETGVNPASHRITLGYDRQRNGILICITKLATGSNKNYWFDLRTDSLFPETYPAVCGVFSQIFYDANDPDYRTLLLGCTDGYIRRFSETAKNDNTGSTDAAISAYVTLGPVALSADPDKKGRIISTTIIAAGGAASGVMGDEDGFHLGFHVANDAETCQEDIEDGAAAFLTVAVTGTGRKTRVRAKIRGAYEAIKVASIASSQTWSFEKITQEVNEIGRIR